MEPPEAHPARWEIIVPAAQPCPNTKQTWFELFLSETEYRNGPIGLTPLSTVFLSTTRLMSDR